MSASGFVDAEPGAHRNRQVAARKAPDKLRRSVTEVHLGSSARV